MLSSKLHTLRTLMFNSCRQVVNRRLYATPSDPKDPKDANAHSTESDIVHLDNRDDIWIPEYPTRPDEPLENRRQRLLYQSRKRGMLENDLLLSTFAAKYLRTMTAEQVEMYDTLINKPSNDWDIYYWATGNKPTPPEYENEMMQMFRTHVKNEMKEKRLRMPDL